MITVGQIRGARAMVGLAQKELAKRAGISVATLNNIERQSQRDPKVSTMRAIQAALEAEGVEFFSETDGRLGLRVMPRAASSKTAPILIVDDSRHDRLLYKRWLQQMPGRQFEIAEATNGKEGFESFLQKKPACVILDFKMYGLDGFQVLAAIKQENGSAPPVILVTGMPSEEIEKKARAQGVSSYFDKNKLTQEQFSEAVAHALRG